jgi:hypothetical protein
MAMASERIDQKFGYSEDNKELIHNNGFMKEVPIIIRYRWLGEKQMHETKCQSWRRHSLSFEQFIKQTLLVNHVDPDMIVSISVADSSSSPSSEASDFIPLESTTKAEISKYLARQSDDNFFTEILIQSDQAKIHKDYLVMKHAFQKIQQTVSSMDLKHISNCVEGVSHIKTIMKQLKTDTTISSNSKTTDPEYQRLFVFLFAAPLLQEKKQGKLSRFGPIFSDLVSSKYPLLEKSVIAMHKAFTIKNFLKILESDQPPAILHLDCHAGMIFTTLDFIPLYFIECFPYFSSTVSCSG